MNGGPGVSRPVYSLSLVKVRVHKPRKVLRSNGSSAQLHGADRAVADELLGEVAAAVDLERDAAFVWQTTGRFWNGMKIGPYQGDILIIPSTLGKLVGEVPLGQP